jgi:hypothetical protein
MFVLSEFLKTSKKLAFVTDGRIDDDNIKALIAHFKQGFSRSFALRHLKFLQREK